MSGTPPVPILPPDPDARGGPIADDAVVRGADADEKPLDPGLAGRQLDPDLDDDMVDSAAADELAAKEGTLDGDASDG